MNIAVLNECFLQKKHLTKLRKLGKVRVYPTTKSEKEAIDRLKNADVAIIHCSLLPITANILKHANRLKYVSLASTGFDLVDLKAAKASKITISNLPTYGTEAVSELAFALIFALVRKVTVLDRLMRRKPFEINSIKDLITSPYVGFNLVEKTLGIIGLGRIGSRVAEIAKAIGMNVIAYDILPRKMAGVRMVKFENVLKDSDIVTLHTPLTSETLDLIGEKQLKIMKPQAFLINTARGKLVNTKALYKALKNKIISGAGIDVLAEIDKSNPLLTLDNVIITPHSAWYTKESFENIADTVVANIEAYIKGKPINVIT
ncbi:hypothetical protein A3C98_00470 [Candidatus Roizmanbacteria bacterium RIFCSPHIGHO2_02_FULL_37_15]|uniref:Hydroxyacid dehydrogenase n=1 Tax=Candidatus Roizmanbacteria bacterium RIFCSPLOWO2_01_FULL_37_16 TaxID=1802058 RepID=A0A1F7IQY3_9BACT|nr:MAG: hypothetical protein A2859_02645 [Candidatus Roizmanbacteria bacterium RIFCSPHIGHO2_01_FULL_37_16b]OGK22207.1 MAG: hypothetical protein A3C98_00470 [Candidatus Roizmanbacteria bacterium RIFCSPHIGHO2_02_FULL_37_15]OGK33237.1 MAG: hypothetical protein A3F57_03045 [Candidatus Roizmanbacteria bacterium RIFCSPHIGHO2_12_FULL_36_11]OGK45722.1 MAG: hypothetical protein A3B40_05605 [Candidatus Roizmanbacteria bacterium RIFCSPLOWO2_01_FULL_37_16]